MKNLMAQAALPLALCFVLLCISCGGGGSSSSSSQPYSPSPADKRNGTYMVCYTQSPSHGINVSRVFHVPPVDQVTMLEEPWAKDFRRYIGQSGDEGAISVSCVPVDPKNPDAALKDKIEAWRKQGIQVGQNNWKYAGG
jgi:hypothetical protein